MAVALLSPVEHISHGSHADPAARKVAGDTFAPLRSEVTSASSAQIFGRLPSGESEVVVPERVSCGQRVGAR